MTPGFLWFLSLICARTAVILLVLTVGLRLLGKRQIGQMNIYDLAMVMALANAVQNAMTNGKGDLSVGIVSSSTLILIGWLFARLFVRHPDMQRRIIGSPTLLVHEGRCVRDHMRRECVSEQQVRTAARQYGLQGLDQVMMAVLEVDGSISIVPKSATSRRTEHRVRRHKHRVETPLDPAQNGGSGVN